VYKNIYYKCDKTTKNMGQIWVSTFDSDGNTIYKTYEHRSHLCYTVPDTAVSDDIHQYKSLYGERLEVKQFNNVYDRYKWMKEHPTTKIYECVQPEREFLLDTYSGRQESDEFSKHPFKVHFIDIECPSEFEFPSPDKAKYPVTLITVYDTGLDEFHVWAFKDFKAPEEYAGRLVKHVFPNEKSMLADWLVWQKKNPPDIVTGWNIEAFDIPYLVNRCFGYFNTKKDENGDVLACEETGAVAKCLSPVGVIRPIIKGVRNTKKKVATYSIYGVSILDYYLMYRYKFTFESRQSWKLGDVCESEIGATKLEHGFDTLFNFQRNDYDNFVKYNIIDVDLCVKLDKKLKFLDLARRVCNLGLVEYEAIMKSQPYIYGILLIEARKQGITLPSLNKYADNCEVDDYEGAYVFEPQVAFFSKGLFSIDFNSLYPNIMISLNISPETKVARIVSETDSLVVLKVHPSGKEKTITKDQFKILRAKTILSSNGVLYYKHDRVRGIIPTFCGKMYSSRVDVRKKMKILKSSKDTESKYLYDRLDVVQLGYKIIMNSIYGVLGSHYFPLYDVDNAEAVTSTGQTLIKTSAEFVTSYFKGHHGAASDVIIAGDTDSLYIDTAPIIDSDYGGIMPTDAESVREVRGKLDGIIEKINHNCENTIKFTFGTDISTISFKRELICASGCFVAKKRYVLRVLDNDGEFVDKFKYVGVDIKKNELPSKTKTVLKSVVEGAMLNGWTDRDFKPIIERIHADFHNAPPSDIAYLKNYGTEKKALSFLSAEKGSGAHARAVIYHNQLIDKLNIRSVEEEIFQGDRFRYAYVKDNQYNIDVIAFKETWPKAFDKYFVIDYGKMFEKTIMSPLKGFVKIFKWSPPTHIEVLTKDFADL
jgi:DNA polymerase elongation subunit (family B)